ncbi:ester cyclase [Nonomuraea sp. NPDC050404]|uniref:ester cyclase n=1 Tax=Nonomuraea sp. NPDC050404 TaxID=3155783 RepID=UPI0033DBA393
MMVNLYRRWLLELWNGDFDAAYELVTPDFVGHWPGREVSGPDGLAEVIRQGHEPFEQVKVTLDVGPIVDGDLVSARWTFSGAYRGGIPGATAAKGTEIAFSGHDILRAQDGRFAEYWVISDAQTFMRSLGIG